jgi:hypothetical protein
VRRRRYGRPSTEAGSGNARRSASHQLTSAQKTITFAIRAHVGEAHEQRHDLERRLEHDCRDDGAGHHVTQGDLRVREQSVCGEDEQEDAEQRYRDGEDVAGDGVRGEPRRVALHDLDAERADDEAREERRDRRDHHHRRDSLAVQERAIRSSVDDVEGGLERAEKRQRRPEERHAADDAEGRSVVLHPVDEREDALERRRRERAAELPDQEVGGVGAMHEPEQRQREKREGHEGKEREVGDHRGEVGAAVGKELGDESSLPGAHGGSFAPC